MCIALNSDDCDDLVRSLWMLPLHSEYLRWATTMMGGGEGSVAGGNSAIN